MPFTRYHPTPPSLRFATFLRANRFFLSGMALLLIGLLYLVITGQQGDELIAINKLRTPFWDRVFIIGTQLGEPITYLAVVLVAITYRLRTALFAVVTGVAVAVFTGLLKIYFAEARPLRYFSENFKDVFDSLVLFDEPMRNVGYSSFPSGHSASAFALFSFICFNVRRPKIAVSILCFLVAAQVGFSRMYLLYHFLRDVTAGAFIGLGIATLMFFLQWKFDPHNETLNSGIRWRSKVPTDPK